MSKKKRTFASQIKRTHITRILEQVKNMIVSFKKIARLILLVGAFCLPAMTAVYAQDRDTVIVDYPTIDALAAAVDTIAGDTTPEWYVKPEIPVALRAPKHATAAGCPVDSILTFNIDSVLVECTLFGYDAAGHTINQEVWTVNSDGSRVGKTKNEYGYTGSKQTMTAVYEWDAAAKAWKGTERYEYTYKGSQMTSKTTFIWLNANWVADEKYTYAYDAAGREIEYYEYKRNTTTNQLEKTKGRIQEWYNATTKTLEIQYTAFANNEPTQGTWTEQHFDANGNKTLEMNYPSMVNGKWVGSSKEEWAYADSLLILNAKYAWGETYWVGTYKEEWGYTDSVLTMNAKYAWGETDWVGTSKEEWGYTDEVLTMNAHYDWKDGAWSGTLKEVWGYTDGNQTLYEKYTSYKNGEWVGYSREQWTYENGNKTFYFKEVWSSGNWKNSIKESWQFNGPNGEQTYHERFSWKNGEWVMNLQATNEYKNGHLVRTENYSLTNGEWTGTKYLTYTYDDATDKKTAYNVYAWENGAWVNDNQEIWSYAGPSNKQTLHEKAVWENGAWKLTLQDSTEYTGSYATKKENYELIDDVWTGKLKEEYTYNGSKKTQTLTYAWVNGAWVNDTKETWDPSSTKPTLHEQFIWDGAWTKTLEEHTTYDGSNKTLIENYALIENVWTGTQKEEHAYSGSQKTQSIIYAWENGVWVNSTKENWTYTDSKLTLHEQFIWDGAWTKTLQENTVYDGGNKILVENYALIDGVWTGTERELWNYTDGHITLHEQFTWSGDWTITLQEKTTYDGNTVVGIENYVYANGYWTVQKEDYVYADGQKTEIIIYAYTNGAWVKSTRSVIGYTSGNTVVSATNYTWNGAAWQGVGNRISTTYDDQNRVTELLTQDWPEGATDWTNKTIAQHTFNAEGEEVLTYNGTWNGTRWAVSSMNRIEYKFDGEGRQLLKASWRCTVDSIWKGVQKDTTAYSALGQMLYNARFTAWKNNKWDYGNNSYEVTYKYDAAGHTIHSQRYYWSGGKWVGSYWYEFGYDAWGNLTMEAQYSWSNNAWKGITKSESGYTENGDLTYTISFSWQTSNKVWVSKNKTVYTRDEQGRLIDKKILSFKNNAWVDYQWNTWTYDNKNREIETSESYWLSNKWYLFSHTKQTYDDDAQNKLRREIKGTWNYSGLVSYADNCYCYACDPRYYTIRFVNYDGTVLYSTSVLEGETPVYEGAKPAKPANEEYTYTFADWTPTIGPATSNITYTASYTATKNSYTITWLNEDGSLIDKTTVEHGVMPAHDDPTKLNTDEYTYTFAGWSPGVGVVTGDATYQATFSATKNSYTITWLNEDGTEIDKTVVEYGATPTHESPTKEATAESIFTFAGWSPEVTNVTGNATYQATFTAMATSYTITWLNEDGTEIEKTTVEVNTVPSHADLTKEATAEYTYTFAGWTPELVAVTADATYTATFTATKNKYTITWWNDKGETIDRTEVVYGTKPTHADAAKEATAEFTYTFAGWTPEIMEVTEDFTYQATFTATVNTYAITFKNGEEVLQNTLVAYGEKPTYTGTTPTKEADAQFTYTFADWDKPIETVAGEATYNATFSSTVNDYTITWLNEDGSTIDQTTVAYGQKPEHADITKQSTELYSYTFAGWTPEIVDVTGNATYTATFTNSVRTYTVTFMNGDQVLQSAQVAYGEKPNYIAATPTKETDAQYSYTFAGWDKTIEAVTGDATYTATFDHTIRYYTITFYYEDGVTVLEQVTVAYGETPVCRYTPSMMADAQHYYTFTGWSPEIVPAEGDASYVPTFELVSRQYTITFKNYDGKELLVAQFGYGEIPEYTGETPTKNATTQYVYQFKGWSPELAPVTQNAVYRAQFETLARTYTVVFYDEDGITELDRVETAYGKKPTTTVIPTKEADEQYIYTFSGWTPKVVSVTKDAAYYATYAAKPKTEDINIIDACAGAQKIIIDNQIYILRGGKKYTITGTLLKDQ